MQVVDLGYREITLVTSDAELAVAVRTTRTVRVIPIGGLIARVRSAFRGLRPRSGPASRAIALAGSVARWTPRDHGRASTVLHSFSRGGSRTWGWPRDSSISSSFGMGRAGFEPAALG